MIMLASDAETMSNRFYNFGGRVLAFKNFPEVGGLHHNSTNYVPVLMEGRIIVGFFTFHDDSHINRETKKDSHILLAK